MLNDTIISQDVADLGVSKWKFNDKCSSVILTNNMPNDPNKVFKLGYYFYQCSKIDAVFIGYEDKDLTGHSIILTCPPAGYKKYPSLPGFNDKLSSLEFIFAQKGQYSESL